MFNMYSWNKSQGCFRDVAFKFQTTCEWFVFDCRDQWISWSKPRVGSSTVWLCPNTFIWNRPIDMLAHQITSILGSFDIGVIHVEGWRGVLGKGLHKTFDDWKFCQIILSNGHELQIVANFMSGMISSMLNSGRPNVCTNSISIMQKLLQIHFQAHL